MSNVVCAGIALAILQCGQQLALPQVPPPLTIRVLDGKDGKPIPNTALIVFGGATTEDVKFHEQHFALKTDGEGRALLQPRDSTQWIQILPDELVLCQPEVRIYFEVNQIVQKGAVSQNTCSKLFATPPVAGVLTIYMRRSGFIDRVRR